MHIFLIILIFFVLSPVAFGVDQPVGRAELWKAIRAYRADVDVGFEVPTYPKYSTWKVSGKLGTDVLYPEKVPVFDLNSLTGEVLEVGTVAVGTEIALEYFKSYQSRYYYEIPGEKIEFSPGITRPTAWVLGSFIAKDPAASFVPPKDFLRTPAFQKRKEAEGKK